jgi:hypothetical protein
MAMRKLILQVLGGVVTGLVIVLSGAAPASGSTTAQITNNDTLDQLPGA